MKTIFDELKQDPAFRKEYAIEGFISDTAELIWQLMESKNIKQADLARLLDKTPAFVSQLLSGKANMTIRTLAEVAYALDSSLKLTHSDCNSTINQKDVNSPDHKFKLVHYQFKSPHQPFMIAQFGHDQELSNVNDHTTNNECVA